MDSAELTRRLEAAGEASREQLLSECLETALRTRDADDYMTVAMGYVFVKRYRDAARVFTVMVRSAGDHPQNAVYRLSLASVYEDLEWYACSRCLREHVAASAPDPELREIAAAEIDRLTVLLKGRATQDDLEAEMVRAESPELAALFAGGFAADRHVSPETRGGASDLLDLLAMEESLGPSPKEMRLAALEDLRGLAERHPQAFNCEFAFDWALLTSGSSDELRERLTAFGARQIPEQDHAFHYNYGQLLLFGLGDAEGARHHLALALRLGTTPEEVSDAQEKIVELRPFIGEMAPG